MNGNFKHALAAAVFARGQAFHRLHLTASAHGVAFLHADGQTG